MTKLRETAGQVVRGNRGYILKTSLKKTSVKRKKGILFSIMALMLLVPILIVSSIHLENHERQKIHANRYLYAHRLSTLEKDLADDLLAVHGFNATVWPGGLLLSGINFTEADISGYLQFVENVYAPAINIPLSLNASEIKINDLSMNISSARFNLSGIDEVSNLSVYVKVLEPIIINETDFPSNQGTGPELYVTIEDYWGSQQVDRFQRMDVSLDNSAFSARYNSTSSSGIAVFIANDELVVETNLTAMVVELSFYYADNRSMKITMGNVSFPEYLGIKRSSLVTLVDG